MNLERMAAEYESDFVVMLLGMRMNRPWKINKWLPVVRAMRAMLKELQANPETGYLGHQQFGFLVVIYWRSFDQLEAYARSKDHAHLPAWVQFRKMQGFTSGDVGLWHELYKVQPGMYESFYSGVPATGIGSFGALHPANSGRETSRDRLKQTQLA